MRHELNHLINNHADPCIITEFSYQITAYVNLAFSNWQVIHYQWTLGQTTHTTGQLSRTPPTFNIYCFYCVTCNWAPWLLVPAFQLFTFLYQHQLNQQIKHFFNTEFEQNPEKNYLVWVDGNRGQYRTLDAAPPLTAKAKNTRTQITSHVIYEVGLLKRSHHTQ